MDRSRNPRICVEHLTAGFGTDVLMRDFSGEFSGAWCIIGPNGSGKTTFLRIIIGLGMNAYVAGRIFINHVDVTHTHPGRREIAYVPQEFNFTPQLTTRTNIELPLRTGRKPRHSLASREAIVADAWRAAALSDTMLEKYPHQLSGGNKQRAMLAGLMVQAKTGKRVWILDEPFSSVDARTRKQLLGRLLEMQGAEGATMLYVTHFADDQAQFGNRVLDLGSPLRVEDKGGCHGKRAVLSR